MFLINTSFEIIWNSYISSSNSHHGTNFIRILVSLPFNLIRYSSSHLLFSISSSLLVRAYTTIYYNKSTVFRVSQVSSQKSLNFKIKQLVCDISFLNQQVSVLSHFLPWCNISIIHFIINRLVFT